MHKKMEPVEREVRDMFEVWMMSTNNHKNTEIFLSQNINKMSHKEWRKFAKKMRRKIHRQKIAKERDSLIEKENSSNLQNPSWLAEQRALDLLKKESEEHSRNATQKQWQEYDQLVQERWKIKQQKIAKIERAKETEKIRIRAEFEAKETKAKHLEEEKIRLADEKFKKHLKLTESINEYINGTGDLPGKLNVNAESNPGKVVCPFFEKTSTCRYGMKCSRNHSRPSISRLLLIPNFFSHIRLEQSKHTEYGNDFSLEIDDAELNRDFNEFFNDVEPELKRFGKILNFLVCSNQEPHLRGHTYVEYEDQRNALKAYRHLQGRYYAGRMLNVEFSHMISWRSAVCGLSFANKCPKGRNCNFLHIFKNPRNSYPLFNQQRSKISQQLLSTVRQKILDGRRVEEKSYLNWDECDDDSSSNKRCWHWTVSPEHRPSTVRSSTSCSRQSPQPHRSSRKSSKSRGRSKNDCHHSERSIGHSDRKERSGRKERKISTSFIDNSSQRKRDKHREMRSREK